MSASGSELSRLRDSRLAPLATAALPAWLWSADLSHIAWANAVGAAVFGAFGGFADDAKLDGGYLALSDRPGIGFEGQSALYAVMRELAA